MFGKYNLVARFALLLLLFCIAGGAEAQPGRSAEFADPGSNLWLGSYTKLRLSNKFFWDAQFHYRTAGDENTRFIARTAQIYNRHGLSYRPAANFMFTVGPVLRLNFSPDPGNPEFKKVVTEPRIWHEYLFAMPYPRFVVYHRLRIEHRWSKGNREGDPWVFRNRWRYKYYMNIPINKPGLMPKTLFFVPDVELIMQTGKTVNASPVEDLRIYPQIGYIHNTKFKYTAGMMYTTGQTLNDPYAFNTRWIIRLNLYMSLDLRKVEDRIPEIRVFD